MSRIVYVYPTILFLVPNAEVPITSDYGIRICWMVVWLKELIALDMSLSKLWELVMDSED